MWQLHLISNRVNLNTLRRHPFEGVSFLSAHLDKEMAIFTSRSHENQFKKSSKTAYLDKERTDFASRCNHTNDTIRVACAVDVATALNK